MLQSNNHLWEDAQIIDITPLPTNIARTPVAHEDSRLLGSQPHSPLDRSQFQLAPKQSQVEQQFVFTQRQPWVYTHSALALLCHCLLNHAGALPSNLRSKYIRLSSSVFSRFFSLSLRSRFPFFHFLACLQALAPLQHSPSPPGPWCCVIRMEGKRRKDSSRRTCVSGVPIPQPHFLSGRTQATHTSVGVCCIQSRSLAKSNGVNPIIPPTSVTVIPSPSAVRPMFLSSNLWC